MRPNILMLFPDQWRGDWIGALSELPLRTPNIDALLARGVGFSRAWTPSPLCAPARSCFATGRGYGRAPVLNNKMDNPLSTPTFYRALLEAGYQVANAGKSDLLKGGNSWGEDGRHMIDGVDRMAALGFSHGFDSAGKKAAEKVLKNNIAEPYTAFLKANGLDQIFLSDYAERSVGKEKPSMSDWIEGRISRPSDAYANVEPVGLPEEAYNDNFVGAAANDLIGSFDRDVPWFLIANFPGPHEPMDVTADMAARWNDVTFPLPVARDNQDADLQQDIRRRYAAMLENIDRWLGTFIETLEKTGQAENTLIVLASDHGEMLGDHNLWKKQVPFEASLHVPMIVAGCGVDRRGVCDRPASLLDLPPTFLALADAKRPSGLEGFDLFDFLAGRGSYPRETSVSGLGCWRAATDGRYKLVVGFDTSIFQEQTQFEPFERSCLSNGCLYDLDVDPQEACNLWDAEPERRDALLAAIEADIGLGLVPSVATAPLSKDQTSKKGSHA